MLPTFDFLVKIDEIYVTLRHFREMSGTLPTKQRPYQQIYSQVKGEIYLVPLLPDQIGLGNQFRRP